MSKPGTLFPVLFATNFDNRLGDQQQEKLRRLGLDPVTTCKLSALPDVLTVQRGPYLAVVTFQDHALQAQTKRAKDLADKAGLPFARLLSQTSHTKEVSDALFPRGTGKEILAELVEGVEVKGRPWGWVKAHQVAGCVHLPDTITSTEEFLRYITRLPPEDLPESLRTRSKPIPPPPSPPRPISAPTSAPPPSDRTTRVVAVNVEETEEYLLLKEEYDALASRVKVLQVESEEYRSLAESRQKQIEALSLELGNQEAQINQLKKTSKGVPESEIPRLVAQWEAKGEAIGRETAYKENAALVDALKDQVATLQKDLEESDRVLSEQMTEHQKTVKSLEEKAQAAQAALQAIRVDLEKVEEKARQGMEGQRILQALRNAGLDLVVRGTPSAAPSAPTPPPARIMKAR